MTEAVWGIDTIDADVAKVPMGTPVIWAYITGTAVRPEIQWEPADIARFSHSQVYRIDQGFGDQLAPDRSFHADEYDLEAQAWTVPALVRVIRERNARQWSTRVYASVGPWTELFNALGVAGVPQRSVYWRAANWSGDEPQARTYLGGAVYAVQWASPESHPDVLIPGTQLTLAEAGADLNVISLRPTGWQG